MILAIYSVLQASNLRFEHLQIRFGHLQTSQAELNYRKANSFHKLLAPAGDRKALAAYSRRLTHTAKPLVSPQAVCRYM